MSWTEKDIEEYNKVIDLYNEFIMEKFKLSPEDIHNTTFMTLDKKFSEVFNIEFTGLMSQLMVHLIINRKPIRKND